MNKNWLWMVLVGVVAVQSSLGSRQVFAQPGPNDLLTVGENFAVNDKMVSTSFFVWYTPLGGQINGAWEPLGGRITWTGQVPFWKEQIKQVMSANIDVINVHLYNDAGGGAAGQRTNLFKALSDLRHEGYDVPKVTPFLDPLITWGATNSVNVATTSGKDTFVNMYKVFYDQYFSVNTDAQADSYLTRIGDSTVLDTWHTHLSLQNQSSLSRADIKSRLEAEYGAAHPLAFGNDKDIYQITTAGNQTLNFADEKVSQFQQHAYEVETNFNGIQTAQVKPGYWDANIRVPGTLLPRDGGSHYEAAWQQVNNNGSLDRVYIESWNEYDESSGIYAAEGAQFPNIGPLNPGSPTDDDWSSTDDSFEYIKTTAAGARQFNDTPDLDASILWDDLPDTMRAGETVNSQVIVRNDGDISWTEADLFRLSQNDTTDPTIFGAARFTIDDLANDIPLYGGIFRGRPVTFDVEVVAPLVPGVYTTHWQMLQEFNARFGEEITQTITVLFPGDYDEDGTVGASDYVLWQNSFGSTVSLAADGNGDGVVDAADYTIWRDNFGSSVAFSNAVPEPSSALQIGILSLVLTFVVRSRNHRKLCSRVVG